MHPKIEYTEDKGKTWKTAFVHMTTGGIKGEVTLEDIKTKKIKKVSAEQTRMIVNITSDKPIVEMKDKNGKEIKSGDSVEMPEPNETDMYIHSFVGFVKGFKDEFVTVEDSEGDCFDIEPERLEIVED
jgi:hypothetical protein